MKLNRTALAALLCTAALGLGACGGGDDSGNGDAAAEDTTTTETSPEKMDPDADSDESPTTSANGAEGEGEEGDAADGDSDEFTATSPGGAISLTANTVPISGPNPRITVSWEAQPNAGGQCVMILTRTDPRGYLLGVEQIDECSGSHDFTLVHGVAADSDDVAGDHVIELDNLDEKATLTATVPE